MPKGRGAHPSEQHTGAWFADFEVCQSQPESTTSSALKQVWNSGAAQYIEDRLPLAYRAREKRAVNNNFPFSSHDNRHCLQNVGEYFDFGMGRRKVEPERRQQNSQNFFLWAHESVPSREDGLTIYQTAFLKDQNIEAHFVGGIRNTTQKNVALTNLFLRMKKPAAKRVILIITTPL